MSTNSKIKKLTESLLKEIGEDPKREGLLNTPHRVSKSWKFLSSGYKTDVNELINNAVFKESYDQMVVVKDIEF